MKTTSLVLLFGGLFAVLQATGCDDGSGADGADGDADVDGVEVDADSYRVDDADTNRGNDADTDRGNDAGTDGDGDTGRDSDMNEPEIYTETHYLTPAGAGLQDGSSFENAWSLTDFNTGTHQCDWSIFDSDDGDIGPNDVVYFSGEFTERVVVLDGGTPSGPITIDGYEAGDCDPLNTDCTSSAVLLQGMTLGDTREGPDYLNIYDFRMTRTNSTNPCFQVYGNVSEGDDDESHIDHINVRRNHVYETNGTMFLYYNGRNSTVEGNKFTHFGQNGTNATQGVNLIRLDGFVLRGNEIGHNEHSFPSGCISAELIEIHGCNRVLVEYNDIYGAPNQAGIRPKEDGGGIQTDIIIRFNFVHDNLGEGTASGAENRGKGIYFRTRETQSISSVYVYGNLISNNQSNIMVGTNVDNVHIWSNVIISGGRGGFETWSTGSSDFYVYNNTFARNGDDGEDNRNRGGVVIGTGSNFNIENNVFWNNRPAGAGSRYNQVYSAVDLSVLEHNTYYHSLSTADFYFDDEVKTLEEMRNSYDFEDDDPEGEIRDYGFNDPSGADDIFGTEDDDYTLDGSCTDDGVVQGGPIATITIQDVDYVMDYRWALDPNNTDWTTTPPTVAVVDQNDYGVGWERGAYAYVH